MPVQAIIRYVVVYLRARVIWQASWSAPAHPPSSIVREHTRQKRGNETALNSKPLCTYGCCCCCSRWVETGISSMRDHARARASPKMKSCRPVCCIVGSSRRCVSFQGRYDSPYRRNWCFIVPVTASADKCFFFLPFFTLYLSFEKRRRKNETFFFLSYSTDHYRYRILWFFSSVFGVFEWRRSCTWPPTKPR